MNRDSIGEELEEDCLGAFFGGGYGGALIDLAELEDVSEEELLKLAREKGIDVSGFL